MKIDELINEVQQSRQITEQMIQINFMNQISILELQEMILLKLKAIK